MEKGYKNIKADRGLVISIIILLAGLFVSTMINGSYRAGWGIIKGWFILPLLFFIIFSSVVKNKENLFKALYFSAFNLSFVGIIYFFLGELTYDGRLKIFLNSPNYLAMYLAPAIFWGAYSLKENKKIYFVTLAIILISLYLTFSYTAWAAIAASFLIMEIFRSGKNFFRSKSFIFLIFIIFIISIFQINNQKINNLINLYERSSIASRMMIWKSSGKILKDNWILGIGPGNFQEKYLEYQKYFPPYLEWAVPHPHNLYLAFWLSGGVLSLVGFFMLISNWFKKILKMKNSQLKLAVLGTMLYILIHGFFDTTYFKNDLAVIFWMLFSIL